MSREKLLWVLSGGLAVLALVLAVLLIQTRFAPPQAGSEQTVGEEAGEQEHPESRPIAQAGDTVLTEDEYVAGLEDMFGDEYVRQWLAQTVVRLEAQALGIDISRAEIDEELRRMQIGYESEAEFYRVMREQLGMSEQELRNDALHRLMLEAIATYRVPVTEADVEQYIEEHPEEFAPQQDIRYAQIVTEQKEQANKVLEQLGQGVAFDLLARDVSLDDATAGNGGDSGWVPADDPFIPEALAKAISAMEVGDVSVPLALEDGRWAVVTLLGRRTIDPLDDSKVKEELRRELALSRAPSLFDVEEALLDKYNAVDFLDGN